MEMISPAFVQEKHQRQQNLVCRNHRFHRSSCTSCTSCSSCSSCLEARAPLEVLACHSLSQRGLSGVLDFFFGSSSSVFLWCLHTQKHKAPPPPPHHHRRRRPSMCFISSESCSGVTTRDLHEVPGCSPEPGGLVRFSRLGSSAPQVFRSCGLQVLLYF